MRIPRGPCDSRIRIVLSTKCPMTLSPTLYPRHHHPCPPPPVFLHCTPHLAVTIAARQPSRLARYPLPSDDCSMTPHRHDIFEPLSVTQMCLPLSSSIFVGHEGSERGIRRRSMGLWMALRYASLYYSVSLPFSLHQYPVPGQPLHLPLFSLSTRTPSRSIESFNTLFDVLNDGLW
jgi:hypothetical protein